MGNFMIYYNYLKLVVHYLLKVIYFVAIMLTEAIIHYKQFNIYFD